MKLKMVRRGTFKCNWRNTENMCGTNGSSNPTYNYVCEIECAPILDKHGFLVDQLDIDRFFQVKYAYSFTHPNGHDAKSCEKMAIECVDDVKYMVESHMMQAAGASQVHRIAVTIFFNDTAAMTAEWKADESVCEAISGKPRRKADGRQRGLNPTNSVSGPTLGRHESPIEDEFGRDSGPKTTTKREWVLTRDERGRFRYSRERTSPE